jgi:heptaprenyl diphosphate synthase
MQLRNRRIAAISLFSAAAVVLYVVESFIPRPLPWMRFGLANIVVLIGLYLFGFRTSFIIALMKTLLGALIIGNLFSPAFLFSIGGSMASILVMAMLLAIPHNPFSPFGISIIGAVSHNLAQLAIAAFLFIGLGEVLFLFPAFVIISIITGSMTGLGAVFILRPLSRIEGWSAYRS